MNLAYFPSVSHNALFAVLYGKLLAIRLPLLKHTPDIQHICWPDVIDGLLIKPSLYFPEFLKLNLLSYGLDSVEAPLCSVWKCSDLLFSSSHPLLAGSEICTTQPKSSRWRLMLTSFTSQALWCYTKTSTLWW